MAELANTWSETAGLAIQKVLAAEILSVTMSRQASVQGYWCRAGVADENHV
jgi:hypothetical protein